MLSAFLFFIAGAIAMRLGQFIFSINPNYYIFKATEYTVLTILAELHVQKLTANKIIEFAYEDAGRISEFKTVKSAIDLRYDALIISCLYNMKKHLPYKTSYNTLEEATVYYLQNKENKDV